MKRYLIMKILFIRTPSNSFLRILGEMNGTRLIQERMRQHATWPYNCNSDVGWLVLGLYLHVHVMIPHTMNTKRFLLHIGSHARSHLFGLISILSCRMRPMLELSSNFIDKSSLNIINKIWCHRDTILLF